MPDAKVEVIDCKAKAEERGYPKG